jgi:hypothetical protein
VAFLHLHERPAIISEIINKFEDPVGISTVPVLLPIEGEPPIRDNRPMSIISIGLQADYSRTYIYPNGGHRMNQQETVHLFSAERDAIATMRVRVAPAKAEALYSEHAIRSVIDEDWVEGEKVLRMHLAWQLKNGSVLLFEYSSRSHPASSFCLCDNAEQYNELCHQLDWVMR